MAVSKSHYVLLYSIQYFYDSLKFTEICKINLKGVTSTSMSAKEMAKKNVITMVNAKMALENTNAYAMMIILEHIVTSLKNLAVETALVKTVPHVMKLVCNQTAFLSNVFAHKVR